MKLTLTIPVPDVPILSVLGYYRAKLSIGNVSIAFLGRDGSTELTAYQDNPVRLNGDSVDGNRDPAVALLYALADDLGYSVSRDGSTGGCCDGPCCRG